MSIDLNREKLKALANELAKDIKTEKDLNALSAELLKMTVEAALGAEMEDHLGYAKQDVKGRGSGNSRNGISRKRLKGDPREIEIEAPRDRNASFEPHSLKLVAWKDYRAVTQGLKEIYQSVCETEASAALDDFARTWDSKYPRISKSWRHHWDNLIALFDYPPQIRKAIYTTNAIESLNSVIRKATKKRKLFPTDDAALKVVYLAVNQASRKWTMPIQNWKLALNRFSIEFGDRVTDHL